MKKIHCFFITISLLSSLGEADLVTRVKEESTTTQAYPCVSRECPSQEEVASYQYIFVDGFLGDYRIRNGNAISAVLKKNFNVTDSFVLAPASTISIPLNAEILYQQVLNLRAQSPHKKAVLMAFSKGGAETLLMVLQHPEFFTSGAISGLLIINGALSGSPLANLWVERCIPATQSAIDTDKGACNTIRRWQGGVTSLRPQHIVPIINRALANLNINDRQFLSQRVWAIQAQWGDKKSELTSPLWPTHLYLDRFGLNDGVILTEGEKLPEGFGENLGVFNFDHTALIKNSSQLALANRNQAFSRAVIREIIFNTKLK